MRQPSSSPGPGSLIELQPSTDRRLRLKVVGSQRAGRRLAYLRAADRRLWEARDDFLLAVPCPAWSDGDLEQPCLVVADESFEKDFDRLDWRGMCPVCRASWHTSMALGDLESFLYAQRCPVHRGGDR